MMKYKVKTSDVVVEGIWKRQIRCRGDKGDVKMVGYTKKHMEEIAHFISLLDVKSIQDATDYWISVLEADNPRFDEERFRKACWKRD